MGPENDEQTFTGWKIGTKTTGHDIGGARRVRRAINVSVSIGRSSPHIIYRVQDGHIPSHSDGPTTLVLNLKF